MKKYIKQISYGVVALFTIIGGLFVITNKSEVDAGAPSQKKCDSGSGSTQTCSDWDDKNGVRHNQRNRSWYSYTERYIPGNGAHCHYWSCSDDGGNADGGSADYKVFNDK